MAGSSVSPLFLSLQATATGGYLLSYQGSIIPVGQAKLPFSYWNPVPDASGFAMAPDGKGGWIAAGYYLKSIGRPPKLVLPPFDKKHKITAVTYNPERFELVVLYEDGGISICKMMEYVSIGSLVLNGEHAVAMASLRDGYYVLTNKCRVYHVTPERAEPVKGLPELGLNLARDIEASPFGEGFYIMDVFGMIHACGGAPQVPSEPLPVSAAVDFEIITGNKIPNWFPSGWNSTIHPQSELLHLDPEGASKTVSLIVENAENLTGFNVEMRYDPSLISISPESVIPGDWWGKNIQGAHVRASLDTDNGVFTLMGGGTFIPYEGASGNGELVRFSVSAAKESIENTTTILDILGFSFQDASPWSLFRSSNSIRSCTVVIAPILPDVSLHWGDKLSKDSTLKSVKPGEIIETDIIVENGSRAAEIEFEMSFSNNLLNLLGLTLGTAWDAHAQATYDFSTPSEVNPDGKLVNQRIHVMKPGGCRDQQGSLVALFFIVQGQGVGEIVLTNLKVYDDKGKSIFEKNIQEKLMFLSK